MQVGVGETEALSQMYCLLAVTLMRQNARAILLRCARTPLHDHNCKTWSALSIPPLMRSIYSFIINIWL